MHKITSEGGWLATPSTPPGSAAVLYLGGEGVAERNLRDDKKEYCANKHICRRQLLPIISVFQMPLCLMAMDEMHLLSVTH